MIGVVCTHCEKSIQNEPEPVRTRCDGCDLEVEGDACRSLASYIDGILAADPAEMRARLEAWKAGLLQEAQENNTAFLEWTNTWRDS